MEITGTQTIAAPRAAVWQALHDPDVLKRCLPGCQSVERVTPTEFRIVMVASIGPMRARFQGTLCMTEADPPQSGVLVFEGQGGAVGFGKGTSRVTLTEAEAGVGTELSYQASAAIGGKLAQVGSRLIDSVARKMSDDFFSAFRRELAAPTTTPADPREPMASKKEGAAPPVRVAEDTPPSPVDRIPPATPVPEASGTTTTQARPPEPTTPAAPASASSTVMVPGWWLGVAMAAGVAATVLGALAVR